MRSWGEHEIKAGEERLKWDKRIERMAGRHGRQQRKVTRNGAACTSTSLTGHTFVRMSCVVGTVGAGRADVCWGMVGADAVDDVEVRRKVCS